MNLQQIIEQKAREEYESALNQIIFEKGASFATTSPEVLKEILVPFAEFTKSYEIFGPEAWIDKKNQTYSTEKLITKFIQETKQKENDQKTEAGHI